MKNILCNDRKRKNDAISISDPQAVFMTRKRIPEFGPMDRYAAVEHRGSFFGSDFALSIGEFFGWLFAILDQMAFKPRFCGTLAGFQRVGHHKNTVISLEKLRPFRCDAPIGDTLTTWECHTLFGTGKEGKQQSVVSR
ncbi:MAG TPA: hypothetical protein VF799_12460 [Geobacteraceae bacterium]